MPLLQTSLVRALLVARFGSRVASVLPLPCQRKSTGLTTTSRNSPQSGRVAEPRPTAPQLVAVMELTRSVQVVIFKF